MEGDFIDPLDLDTIQLNEVEDEFMSFFGKEIESGESDLINSDYNLDSPLNPCFIEELINTGKQRTKPKVFRKKIEREWCVIAAEKGYEWFKRLPKDREFHKEFIKIHKEFDKIQIVNNSEFDEFFSETLLDDLTISIRDIMVETYGIRDVRLTDISQSLKTILGVRTNKFTKYFEIWKYLDLIIKMRNYFRVYKNLDKFKKIKNLKIEKENNVDTFSYTYSFKRYNKVISGTVFCETYLTFSETFLFTHDEILMMKDVFFSRFMTNIIIELNLNRKYSNTLNTTLSRIINSGDDLILRTGNKAYDSLKMLESLSTYRLMEMAEDHNMLDLTESLGEHINRTIDESEGGRCFLTSVQQELNNITDPDDLATIFGSFRIWGHPYIEVEEGLKSLKELVRREVKVDELYANKLASDLAKICLEDHFRKTGKWGVDLSKLQKKSPFYPYVQDQVWPNRDTIERLPETWNKLPLSKIYEVPTDINLSTLYADKSHSSTRSELAEILRKDPYNPIPSKKVLTSLLEKEVMSPVEFLEEVSKSGIDINDLIIGLREKEREMKRKGRFFTLMAWKLREYIVLTEYLIKKFFLPHFNGITMADGLTTVLKKMIKLTEGQSGEERKLISIANHIDYEKWNNLQRGKSVHPVFRVMDKLLGFEGPVIARTHEFFEKTLVYYAGRPDKLKMYKEEGVWKVTEEGGYGWNGQYGGFEGIRQKGWTVCGALLVARESKRNNVKVNLLAQGDNQIIVTNFKIQDNKSDDDIRNIKMINELTMSRIFRGAESLGLSINRDETMSSSRLLMYGKIIVYRGNFVNTETKKWSRATSVSNDQIPTSSNIMGAIATTSIGSSQFEDNVATSFIFFCGVGLISYKNSMLYNPISNLELNHKPNLNSTMAWLFMDKSIGGYTGMSPSRLLIRQFPDPITESLSFWRIMSNYKQFSKLAKVCYNPIMSRRLNYESLVENPTGLNIVSGSSVENAIKDEIRKALKHQKFKIKNNYIKAALEYDESARTPLIKFLLSIKPCFPRFLSEFKEGTEIGLSDTIIGLIQNSRTIRNFFKKKFSDKVKKIVQSGENYTLTWIDERLPHIVESMRSNQALVCSATRADELRKISWRVNIVGITVPHPLEYLKISNKSLENEPHILCCGNTKIPLKSRIERGPLKPYLGSKTTETTSVINQWDKEIKNPLSKKAFNLTRAIGWFINPESNLSKSIMNNLNVLKQEEEEIQLISYSGSRTGTAFHRFSSSRVSNGGFISTSPNLPSWMFVTAESLGYIQRENYDFMYQASMLFCQFLYIHSYPVSRRSVEYYKWSCYECLRQINDVELEAPYIFHPLSFRKSSGVTNLVKLLLEVGQIDLEELVTTINIDDLGLDQKKISYLVGMNLGLIYSSQKWTGLNEEQETSLFPNTIRDKLEIIEFFNGFLDSLRLSTIIPVVRRYRRSGKMDPMALIKGSVLYLISELRTNNQALIIFNSNRFRKRMIEMTGYIPPSFPTSKDDIQNLLIKYYIKINNLRKWETSIYTISKYPYFFSDVGNSNIITIYCSGLNIMEDLINVKPHLSLIRKKIKTLKNVMLTLTTGVISHSFKSLIRKYNIKTIKSEVRHGLKNYVNLGLGDSTNYEWTEEGTVNTESITLELSSNKCNNLDIQHFQHKENPIITGLRLNRLPTGGHYKIRSILKDKDIIEPDLILVCGDGSGGMGSSILRHFKNSHVIHNSLISTPSLDNGITPQLPSGYLFLNSEDIERLRNGEDYWKHPSDLSDEESWQYFSSLIKTSDDSIGILIDAEVTNNETNELICVNLYHFLLNHQELIEWVIFKTYDDRLVERKIPKHFNLFIHNEALKTDLTSTYSSESYIYSYKLQPVKTNMDYLDQNSIIKIQSRYKEWGTERHLLSRIKRNQTNKGLHEGPPKHLILDYKEIILNYLYESGVSAVKLNSLVIETLRSKIIAKSIQIMVNVSLKRNLRVKKDHVGLLIPESGKIRRLIGCLSGLNIYSSLWVKKEEDVFKIGESLINTGITLIGRTKEHSENLVSISYKKTETKRKNSRSKIKNDSNKIRKFYYLNKNSKEDAALWIRFLEWMRICNTNEQNTELKEENNNLFINEDIMRIITRINYKTGRRGNTEVLEGFTNIEADLQDDENMEGIII